MIKISALNEESSEENDEESTPTITNEAQEQIALTEYNKALELLKEEKVDEALSVFKDLLETTLLDQVEKPKVPDGRTRPMLSLKYCCYKNIGGIYAQMEHYEEAIDNYWEAANLDDTDVMLWCRMGKLAMKTSNLEFACSAFKQGLKCNPNHWPCLDSIITVMYAVPDYMNCLLYISMALEKDASYVKGLAFREKIFKNVPYFEESYKLFNPDWALDPPLDCEFDRILGEKLIAEAKEVADKWIEICKPEFEYKPLPELSLQKPLANYSWLELGQSLVNMHKFIHENNINFISKIKLDIKNKNDEAKEGEIHEQNLEELEVPEDIVLHLDSDSLPDMDVEPSTEEKIMIEISENSNDQEVPDVQTENDMVVGVEDDDKSNRSSDIQVIDDKNPVLLETSEGINQPETETDRKLEETSDLQDDSNILPTLTEDISEKPETIEINDNEKSKDKLKSEKSSEQTEPKDEQQKVKKRRRSSLCFLQQWAWSSSSQRRSPRVRGSTRREAEREDVQLEEIMRRIFPSNLLPDTTKIIRDDPMKSMDDSMDTMDLYQLFANRDNTSNNEGTKSCESSKPPSPECSDKYFDSEAETNDVLEFINQHSGKSNLMIIIARFTEFLARKWNFEWPKELIEVYLQAYLFTREHIPHCSPFADINEEESILKYDAEMTLLFCELHTDRWLDNKPEIFPTSTLNEFGTGIPSEELGYIIFASVRGETLKEDNILFVLRVLWVKANLFMCQGDTDVAIKSLQLLLHDMQETVPAKSALKLPNCKYHSRINLAIVQKRLTAIERGQKLGEVQKLYDEKRFSELSLILQDTFKFSKQRNEILTVMKLNIDRIKQLSMLLDCFWQLQQYEDCYVWAEACLNEAWQIYINSSDELDQKKWSECVKNSLEKLESCVELAGTMIVKYLPDSKATRLVQNLIQIVCHQLDVSETAIEMPLETVIPWILLHHILQFEDDKDRAKSKTTQKSKTSDTHDSESEDDDKDIPPAIMILFTGHDFLGRHSWCCINEAKLLIFIMKTVIPSMCGPRLLALREKIGKHLEQIFWCLYGHPNRSNKTKPKNLEDHGVPQVPLTWEIAQLLFEFYKPEAEIFPEFDTPRATGITADTEILFKKISTLVPKENDPSGMVEEMTSYIVGDIQKPPMVKKALPYQIDSLFYLLGDFSFKNNIWPSAIKYCTMDVVLHPNAFNSWVTLAMSVSTLIGTCLNNCKPLSDIMKLLHQAKMAQCSYRKAVELKPGHSVIWIEYGSFVYAVHSFCSRLLKQESDTLSMEKFAILETRKEDTLEAAANCFQSANQIFLANVDDEPHMQDERWLYHYMLAKIAEKKNEDPPVFLNLYSKASDLLHQNNAHYPRRISHKSAHYLSIEALEVHYRIHASILKYLEQHEGKPLKKSLGQLFLKILVDCASGPFMQYQSKLSKNKRKEDLNCQDKIENGTVENFGIETTTTSGILGEKRQYITEEIISSEKAETKSKTESRKRVREQAPEESSKRVKVSNFSHLQLMHEVVGLIDDLITNVCDIVGQQEQKEVSSDEVMVISSDESDKERPNHFDKNETLGTKIATGNAQDIMDDLMKQAMETSEAQLITDEDDVRKDTTKWVCADDVAKEKELKEKHDKKKSHVNTLKNAATMSRRGSQESTTTTLTTTTNETNNSSFSSSDESSSSDDSSDSDSSSIGSDSDTGESDGEKKKTANLEEKEEFLTDAEVSKIVAYCLAGLEQCVLRFPEHYKSIYRLCHFYFNTKNAKDNSKCRDLLLGTYKCQYYTGSTFQGLFADRKNTNFFNGVWRIPSEEIDRPGSFASHMSRCVTLLMQVLKETDDSRMLMELCVQLRKTPDVDKKYVRDSEREQLSRQALTLCLQSLKTRLASMGPPNATDNAQLFRTDPRTHILLDVYKTYQQVQKNFQGKEVQAFATLLVDTYKAYMGIKTAEGNLLEVAIRCCQQQNLANKIAASNSSYQSQTVPATAAPSISPAAPVQPQPVPTSPQAPQQRKPYKHTGTGRPRGRPPNVNKYLQAMQSGNIMNQFNKTGGFGNYLGGTGSQSLMNPFFMNPLMDQNMLSAMLASSLSGNMMDPLSAVNYITQLGNYQDILRQYQNNLSMNTLASYGNLPTSLPNVSNMPPMSTMSTSVASNAVVPPTGISSRGSMSNLSNLTVQQLLNLNSSAGSTTSTTMMYSQPKAVATTTTASKDLPHSISITPVGVPMTKQKPKHLPVHTDPIAPHIAKAMHASQPPKSISHSPTQISLLKPSVIQPPKTTPPKQMPAPQIRVSKTLSEPQPAHNSSFSLSPLKTGASSSMNLPPLGHTNLSNSGLNIQPVPMGMQSRGTSLQHKLQSKKRGQPMPSHKMSQNPVKKHRSSSKNQNPPLPTNIHNLLSISGASAMSASPFIPAELSGISVSPVNQPIAQKMPSKHSSFRKTSKTKAIDLPGSIQNPLPQPNAAETLSMLSQLQQHSHLEIIPQSKSHKTSVDYTKNIPLSLSVVPPKPMENIRPVISEPMPVYDMPRKPITNPPKKADKHANDKVEIITLDD